LRRDGMGMVSLFLPAACDLVGLVVEKATTGASL
jgi:hypothetical protein